MRSFVVSMLLVGASALPAAPPPGYISTTLPNGLTVSILPDPTRPIVATQV